jgi:predicted HTH transcriptional regulator
VLLADDSPIRQSRLFCTRWYGLDKASGIMDALDDKEYSGSLVSLLQNGTEFVKNNTKKRWKKVGNGRVEMPEYPEQAVHEVIVNALIHRDYMEIGSEVHIDIFDDRMEVYSPGGMFDGSIVQNLDTDHVASKRRNPVIADIFSRMHFMERRGSGFKKIKADYRHAVSYRPELEPVFQSTPTSFFATLYNLNYNVAIKKVAIAPKNVAIDVAIDSLIASKATIEKVKTVYANFGTDGVFGRSTIAAITNDSVTAAGNLIKKLKEAGLIESVSGQGKGKYKFIEPNE